MKRPAEQIYDLLPSVYRYRDERADGILKALSEVIGQEYAVIQESLARLYDDQFAETCDSSLLPYIGDLIGYRLLNGDVPGLAAPRADVANTIAYRRRKGTATALEQMAVDVTRWPARVVEFFQLIATCQHMNHVRPNHAYAPDLRQWEPLERLETAFGSIPHTVDTRQPQAGGRYNIPNIGIFLWRIQSWALHRTPAVAIDSVRFLASPLGHDQPLYNKMRRESDITHLAEPGNRPAPVSRRVLDAYLDRYYGEDESLYLWIDGSGVDMADIEVCHLGDDGGNWAHVPTTRIAIDPVLGRIALPPALSGANVEIRYHYGFAKAMSGGQYERTESFSIAAAPNETVASGQSIQTAVGAVQSGGVVEIVDNGRYVESVNVTVDANAHLELRAANGMRPTLLPGGPMQLSGGAQSTLSINGLVLGGQPLVVPASAELERLVLRHCTLVPGLGLDVDGTPQQPGSPSLIIEAAGVEVELEECIVGAIRTNVEAGVVIRNCIIDSNSRSGVAYADVSGDGPGAPLTIVNTTVFGKLNAFEMTLASNVIFHAALASGDTWAGPVLSTKKQEGCVRFSYVPVGSQLPRRYRCQPDLALRRALKSAEDGQGVPLTPAQKQQVASRVHGRVRPVHTSRRFGVSEYGQLSSACPIEISTGADDESEMGAFHDLFQPQRETNLRTRLDEYLRFGLDAGVFYAS